MEKQKLSAEFMKAAGQTIAERPVRYADFNTRKLRVLLLLEEVLELAEASGVNIITRNNNVYLGSDTFKNNLEIEDGGEFDVVEVADALGDILYVTYGAGNAYGIELNEVFGAIQDSNMSKFIDGHKDEETGKWVKGPSYTPVDLKAVIENQSK